MTLPKKLLFCYCRNSSRCKEREIYCRIRKKPPFVSILRHENPVYSFQSYFPQIHFNTTLSNMRERFDTISYWVYLQACFYLPLAI